MEQYKLNELFPTEEAVIEHFIKIRYPNGVSCPHCGATFKVYHRKDRPKLFQCCNCDNHFSIFKDTIFEKTRVDLRKWMLAINFMVNDKKGASALQLQRYIGGSYETSWRMMKQIRKAMGNEETRELFEAIVEVDETYIGGKPRKDNDSKGKGGNGGLEEDSSEPKSKRGRGTDKTPIIGIKERSQGRVYAKVALPNEQGQKLTGKQLLNVISSACSKDATVITDNLSSYNILDRKGYVHLTINHSAGQFSDGNGKHTNGIEGFWALFKRGVYGMYHHISVKHMQKYVDEFVFRQNNRKNKDAFNTLLEQCVLKSQHF